MAPIKEQDRIYFGGLNGLRFFAATAVIFHHVEQYKLWASREHTWYGSVFGGDSMLSIFFEALGNKAVSLFFVLSGFLITYLLLAEAEKTNTVNLRKFYMRRILRIWPVYYLVIALTFLVMPHFFDIGHYGSDMLANRWWLWLSLCLFMLPNLVRFNSVELVGGNQTWSVGVEEQFYIIWPFLVRTFRKRFVRMLLIFIVAKTVIYATALAIAAAVPTGTIHTLANKFALYWGILKIEQMAVGALGAWYLYQRKEKILNFVYHPLTGIFSLLLVASFFFFKVTFVGDTLLEAFVFLMLIMNVSTNASFPLKFKHPVFNTLGNISYGIYMYHTLVIAFVMTLLHRYGLDQDMGTFNVLLYTLSCLLTIGVSWLSYQYFENWFLQLKEKFMVVKSSSRGDATAIQVDAVQSGSEEVSSSTVHYK